MKSPETVNNCFASNPFLLEPHDCNRTSWLSPAIFCLLLLLVFIFSVSSIQAADWKAEKKNLEQKITSQSISIKQLETGLHQQQEKAQENIAQEAALLAELAILNAELLKHGAKLAALEDSMARQEEKISSKEKEILPLQAEKLKVQTHLQKRIAAYYKTGEIGMINVAFSAKSLPELLSIHDSFNALLHYDQSLLEHYRETLSGLERSKKALTLEKSVLENFIALAAQEKEALEKTSREKYELLTQIQTQARLHERAAREIQREADALSAQLAAMQRKKEILSQEFLLNKGKLSPPVRGTLLSLYGQPGKSKTGTPGITTGISIDGPNGIRVKAVFEGTVSHVGYLPGYGNSIIIDHGFQYATVISRIETILKKEGDRVKTGEDIGITGETATLMEEGVYFEVRHGKDTEDPLLWLDKNKLSLP
jgi:septal ring factor EnvC (AmiA/AmiB activator)